MADAAALLALTRVATAAVRINTAATKAARRRNAAALHAAQRATTERRVKVALRPFFAAQVKSAAVRLRAEKSTKGGPGSGNFGHEGRPGEIGGSGAGGHITDTPEFKLWFGDSKVVDSDGKPLVVFHGTTKPFASFDEGEANSDSTVGVGFHFAESSVIAESFTNRRGRQQSPEDVPRVIPVYLRIENPLDFYETVPISEIKRWAEEVRATMQPPDPYGLARDGIRPASWFKLDSDIKSLEKNHPNGIEGIKAWRFIARHTGPSNSEVNRIIQSTGRDGISYFSKDKSGTPATTSSADKFGRVFVAFRATQIKSAIHNTGDFDPNDPNLYKSAKLHDPAAPANTTQAARLATQIFNPRAWDARLKDLALPPLARGMAAAATTEILALGVQLPAHKGYDPDEPRDEHGRWGVGGEQTTMDSPDAYLAAYSADLGDVSDETYTRAYEEARKAGVAWVDGGVNPVIESLYKETQSKLATSGTTEIQSYRGVKLSRGNSLYDAIKRGDVEIGQEVEISGAKFASWSEDSHRAYTFALHGASGDELRKSEIGVVFERVVAAKDVVTGPKYHEGGFGRLSKVGKELIAKNESPSIKVKIQMVIDPWAP